MWYINAWRLYTLFIGVSILHYGALTEGAPDWDLPVSYLMAGVTYLLMPLFDTHVEQHRYLSAACVATVCVDTTYGLYWDYMGNCLASQVINYTASLSLFLMCWLAWCVLPRFIQERR